jgi:hypothetical protein
MSGWKDDWEVDKAWADPYMPAVKRAIGEALITEAPLEEDISHNTDLMMPGLRVLQTRSIGVDTGIVRIGVRIRRPGVYENYGDEFTIRAARATTGRTTEWKKIMDGWGHLFFYGHGEEDGVTLAAWGLGRLDVFREYCWRHGGKLHARKENSDWEDTRFAVFKWRQLPREFILGEHKIPPLGAMRPFRLVEAPSVREVVAAMRLKQDNADTKTATTTTRPNKKPQQLGLFDLGRVGDVS